MRARTLTGAVSALLTAVAPLAAQPSNPSFQPESSPNCFRPDARVVGGVLPNGDVDVSVHEGGRQWIDIWRIIGWLNGAPIFERVERVHATPCRHPQPNRQP